MEPCAGHRLAAFVASDQITSQRSKLRLVLPHTGLAGKQFFFALFLVFTGLAVTAHLLFPLQLTGNQAVNCRVLLIGQPMP
ncbi:hypothetical protein BHE74_00013838 [Ensete ventricosum]|nr:hypothetical protein BHE74_00013838 [Ensete ventricosum]